MRKRFSIILFLLTLFLENLSAQVTLAGKVVSYADNKPVEFASLLIAESGQWAVTDAKGHFTIKGVGKGSVTLTVQCLGYQKRSWTLMVSDNVYTLNLRIKEENLKLDDVIVTAKRKTNENTTSYIIDHSALENQQILNVSDINALLPGGKTTNATLMDDSRMALRSGATERGNASFGTAIEVDGVRLNNNATIGETAGASTRTISTTNIESIEVITGIPSVEYGDLSNGVVKVNTRRGQSPFVVEGKINQHTRQLAFSKGFNLARNRGVLNVSLEHARSFSDAASPYTAYQRNILSLDYSNTFFTESLPLTMHLGVTGNIGGLNSEKDPDQDLDDYSKTRDHALRTHLELDWLLNKPWITRLSLRGSLSASNQTTEHYEHESSATTLAYNHSHVEGYFLATDYDSNPDAPIILGPTGYWHVKSYRDSKPLNWSLRLKGDWTRRFGTVLSRLMLGAEYTGSRNNGRGLYYDDMRYAPDWQEYRYSDLPTMHNLALYVEEKVTIPTAKRSGFELTAGLRNDITLIHGSDYGTVSSLSPRFNSRYVFWRNQYRRWVSELSVHAGWGKSVKLPSFQILYPDPAYYSVEVFRSPSDANNKTVSGYYTRPLQTVSNPNLKWQSTHQTDIGVEMNLKGTRISLSAFHHRTYHPYIAVKSYTPISYQYTTVADLNTVMAAQSIAASDAVYSVQQTTGAVTVQSADGSKSALVPGNTRKTYYPTSHYVNASPLDRYGLEWMIDCTPIKPLNTSIRLDGNYYYYRGADNLFFADIHNSQARMSLTNEPYQYVGWYRGSNATSGVASATVSNGALSRQLNLNTTITTHIPKIRLIMALRIESSLYSYRRSTSDYFNDADQALYPEYYSTWDAPDERIPFLERYLWAKANDVNLYNDLDNLVLRPNNAYTLRPNRISAYYSANFSVTKEIGDHVSVSFYANNFFNTMKMVHSSQTDTESSLFSSGYIPSYYYGLSLRLKL